MTVARRWTNQDTYAAILDAAADRYSIPRDLAYGLVAQESGFNPLAFRAEPALNDGSYGLTQVLYATARGLGYTGQAAGLFDPAVNAPLGMKYLAEQYRRVGFDWPAALSAYNGGFRPASGYGARLADGRFRNQSYVDGVGAKASYFALYLAEQDTPAGPGAPAPTEAGGGFLTLLLGGGLLAALIQRFKKRRWPA